jgi:hypothetical protein
MAVASTNAWKVNVEEAIQRGIKGEFVTSLPVFRSRDFQQRGNQFCILKGEDSEPNNTMYQRLSNDYNLTLEFFMLDHRRNEITVKKFFRTVSRIEEVFYALIDIDPVFSSEITQIIYEDDIEFNGYRKATFSVTVRNIR